MHEDRRSVLAKFVTAGLGLIGTGLAALVGFVAAPISRGSDRRWRRSRLFELWE